jgi:hypothetical protein
MQCCQCSVTDWLAWCGVVRMLCTCACAQRCVQLLWLVVCVHTHTHGCKHRSRLCQQSDDDASHTGLCHSHFPCTQGWPQTYFQDPLVKVDQDQGTLWFGLDAVNSLLAAPCAVRLSAAHSPYAWVGWDARAVCAPWLMHCCRMHPARTLLVHCYNKVCAPCF